ncbi:putative WD repeat-containing [Hyphodiscus hymeniophilus]|uniref:WD repeat-containing n=1 Tax=Hyphodiscus hymeniophilus TaxID=353542 RepID=A0A9P6VR97_9HELO|nr:putative WD repeat-containing [Hyphodiscus hymeniophilus]
MNKGKIMRKLLGHHTTTTSEIQDSSSIYGDSPQPQLRPNASQNTVYSARAPVVCLDRSPDGQRAVIAGAKIFKTLRIDGSTITDDIDLRSIISTYAPAHDISASTADQFNIKAIKWSHSDLDTTIITACGNGRITLYDLNRVGEGLEVARIQEHARQVHQLAINPFKCNWLLSASQDGTVKLFDIRTPMQGRNGLIFKASQTFKCNADAVRDVKWSPTDGFEFACSTDSGAILKWDIRKPQNPNLRITAHQNSCFSISWHPDGEYLVSGGIDQQCKVWDVSKKAESRQKPRYAFATQAPISSVSWRPPCWSATAQGKRAAQVTVAYDDTNPGRNQTSVVHLWDLARPTLPFKEIEQWGIAPSGLIWNTRDLLWSVDKDGHFTQTDVAFVRQLIDRHSLSEFAFSPNGDLLMLLEQRQLPRRPRPSISSPAVSPGYQHNPSGPLLSISRSDSEEDVIGSFLGPKQRKHHRRRHSSRSTQGLSTTPPSITNMAEHKVMSLEDAVMVTGTYKAQQVMAIGHAPSTAKRETYQHFSNSYLGRMAKNKLATDAQPITDQLASTMEYFAITAENAGHYRLAQTWRLLAFIMHLLLLRRAEHHRQSRVQLQQGPPKKILVKEENRSPRSVKGEETPRKITRANTPSHSPLRTAMKTASDEIESTSNVATPLVHAIRDSVAQEGREAMHTPLLGDDILELPEAAHSASPTLIPGPGSSLVSDKTTSSIEGYDYFDTESFLPSAGNVAPRRKQPLRLDYANHDETISRIQPQRHDSGESFQMFSTSADSSKFMSSGESDVHSVLKENSLALRERVSGWESGFHDETHRSSIDSDAPGQSESSDEQMPSYDEKQGINIGQPQSQTVEPPPIFRIQEASVPSVINTDPVKVNADEEEEVSPSSTEKVSDDPNIIASDFLPWPNDPLFVIKPIDPTILVQRSIDFECQTGALNASAMVLLLRPLLPPEAIDDIQASAILRQYHHRLTGMKLFTEATRLRNLCVPDYPSVFSVAQDNISIRYFCTDCHKPLEDDPAIPGLPWKCPRCKQAMDGCAVCQQRDLDESLTYPAEETVDSIIWFYCPGCGHGGHTACLAAWHSGLQFSEGDNHSGGSCPLEGCLHPCLPGTWREQRAEEKRVLKAKELDSLVKESARRSSSGAGRGGGVRRDNREVAQSKAVEGVRVALGLGGLERKKSVKVIAPGEEGRSSK